MNENRKLKVFLCHSKDDKPKVRELYRRLVADGFDPWLDEEKLIPGQDWDLEIRKAVRVSDVVVVCLSKDSVTKKGYLQKEIRFALDIADEQPEGAIYLIPARLEDCEVPSRLNKWQWVNLFENKGNKQLVASLKLRASALNIVSNSPFEFEPQMIRIPAGKFLMGTTKEQAAQVINNSGGKVWADAHWESINWEKTIEREQPQHIVELSEYLIGKYPITNREYRAFVLDSKHNPSLDWKDKQFLDTKGGYPAVYVSWYDANEYCKWLSEKTNKNYRLPTEAEWEKAARGEDGRLYPWGNGFISSLFHTTNDDIGDTSEVGKFSPYGDSPYGCADMAGNVAEWCYDWFKEDAYEQRRGLIVKDPQGPEDGTARSIRGWSALGDSHGHLARVSYRHGNTPIVRGLDLGFRVVMSPIKIEMEN